VPKGYAHTDFEKMIAETRPDIVIVTTVDATHAIYLVRYDNNLSLSYSRNAWEGYQIAFNGTLGRLEHSIVEALTSALAGHGRSDPPRRWGASVFLQLIGPAGLGGREAFAREMSALAESCRTTPVAPGAPPVRVPGDGSQQLRADQLQNGVALHPTILPALGPWAEQLGVPPPAPVAS